MLDKIHQIKEYRKNQKQFYREFYEVQAILNDFLDQFKDDPITYKNLKEITKCETEEIFFKK